MPRKKASKGSSMVRSKSVSRRRSLVERDITLLKDWAINNTEIELIHHAGDVAIAYKGHIVELDSSKDTLNDFMFLSSAGKMSVLLFPWSWRKSEIDRVADIWLTLHIWHRTNSRSGIALRESLGKHKTSPNLQQVLDQLRSWARGNVELAVFIDNGSHALFFLAQAIEIANNLFSFAERRTKQVQLVAAVANFSYVTIENADVDSVVKLMDTDRKSVCTISAAPVSPEELFKRYKFQSQSIQ